MWVTVLAEEYGLKPGYVVEFVFAFRSLLLSPAKIGCCQLPKFDNDWSPYW